MKLFEAGEIGKLSVKNRVVMAPMGIGGLREPDGRFSQGTIDYYVARAKGGTGLIITSDTRVSREIEQNPSLPFANGLIVDSGVYMARLSQMADSVHDYGTKIAIQLTAGMGRNAGLQNLKAIGAVAPSPVPCFSDHSVIARELTKDEIKRLIKAFEFAASLLSDAGIDAIELHGHEGYLFDEFMTALWNKRTDEYGGDLDGRLRFASEVIEAIKRGAGADFPIIYRYGLTHYLEGGREIDEGLEIARRLEALGVSALHIDAGCYETWYWAHPTTTMPRGPLVGLAEKVKKVVGIPVITVGKLGYPELAERVLQEGKADFIALGRQLLADPDWANKVKEGNVQDICPCLGCHDCLSRIEQGKYISCAVNPSCGMERELTIEVAERQKSVLMVGGGPGGMEAARVAALKGHKVTLWEKGENLGGNLIPASAPDFKQDYRSLIDYLSTQIKKLGVTIELGKEATPELIYKMRPEVVFIATGSTPTIPDIPGIEKKKVVTAVELLLGGKEAGESVVVIGGGSIGCETALYLAQKGKKVTVVEILDSVMRDIFGANKAHLLELLSAANVKILTEVSVSSITDEGINVINKNDEKSVLKVDTVALAVGMNPYGGLFDSIKDKVPEVYAIGDCVEPRRVINAVWEGFRLARLI